VLPAFTSVSTLSSWNPKARPVPAAGPRIALAAASEQTQLVVIDPTAPTEFVLRRPMVTALGTGAPWSPPWTDPDVAEAFRASVVDENAVVGIGLQAGDPGSRLQGPEVQVVLAVVQGLGAEAVQQLVRRISGRWASSAVIADRVDSMAVKLQAA
jgi:hypothetical protein